MGGSVRQTQSMPSTFLRLAVDFDGDGRRDIVEFRAGRARFDSELSPQIGLALPASLGGSRSSCPTAIRARLGARPDNPCPTGPARGVTARRRTLRSARATPASCRPPGASGPAFLVTRNFDAVYPYNAAESSPSPPACSPIASAAGAGIVTPWPTDDPLLSRDGRKELQALLQRRGYDIGGDPDGHIGTKSRAAIADFRTKAGIDVNGRASVKVLEAIKK